MGFYREGKPVKVGDKTYPSMSAWSRACGLSMGCLIYRLSKGMTPEEAEDPKDYRELTTGHKIPPCGFGKMADHYGLSIKTAAGKGKQNEGAPEDQLIAHKKTTTEELRNLITKGSKY